MTLRCCCSVSLWGAMTRWWAPPCSSLRKSSMRWERKRTHQSAATIDGNAPLGFCGHAPSADPWTVFFFCFFFDTNFLLALCLSPSLSRSSWVPAMLSCPPSLLMPWCSQSLSLRRETWRVRKVTQHTQVQLTHNLSVSYLFTRSVSFPTTRGQLSRNFVDDTLHTLVVKGSTQWSVPAVIYRYLLMRLAYSQFSNSSQRWSLSLGTIREGQSHTDYFHIIIRLMAVSTAANDITCHWQVMETAQTALAQ